MGAPRKAEEIKQLVPPWMETRYPSLAGALLHAMGTEDHRITVGDRTLFVRGADPAGNLLYTAKQDNASIRVKHYRPLVNPSALSVSVSGTDILVTLETNANAEVLSTATQVEAAVVALTAANDLVGVTTYGSADAAVGYFKEYLSLEPDGLEGARQDVLLNYSRGQDLIALGNNYGVAKPTLLGLTDTQFRAYVAALAFQKKCSRATIEAVLTVIFGPKATAGWEVFESLRRRTITIEVAPAALPTGPASGTFLRAASPSSTAEWTGDYLRSSAVATYVPKVKPFTGAPLSDVANNSVYARMSGASRPALIAVIQLVRAAGVQVEFRHRRD